MHIRGRIALILLALVSGVTVSSGANYIRPVEIVLRDTVGAGHGSATKAHIAEVGGVEERRDRRQSSIALRPQRPPVRNDSTESKKTLALLLLMLRDGRGAR